MYKECDNYLFSSLDFEKEKLINSVNKKGNVLIENDIIHDEEVLLNLIGDNLYKENGVIIVSDNEEEIKAIKEKFPKRTLLLKDYFENKDEVLNNIKSDIESFSANTGKTTLSKIQVLSREIDKKVDYLDKISLFLKEKRYTGLSLMEMYDITEKRLRKGDERYEYYRVFRVKKPFLDYSYEELNKGVNDVIDKFIINKYIKFKRFANNKLFTKVKSNITAEAIDRVNRKISVLLNNEQAFELPINNSQYTDDFLEYYVQNYHMKEEEVSKIAKEVNNKYNCELLETSEVNGILKIFKGKKILKEKEENEKEYIKIYNMIYDEFLDNLECLSIFINAFGFLKEAITDDEFDTFINTLLNGDEVIEYLKTLKNALSIYEGFRDLTKDVKNLDGLYLEILEYAYESIEKKEDIKKVLKYLPNLYLYLAIEETEIKMKSSMCHFDEIEKFIDEIVKSQDTKRGFILEGIDYIWENKVKEIIKGEKVSVIFDEIEEKKILNIMSSIYPIIIAENIDEIEAFKENEVIKKLIVLSQNSNIDYNAFEDFDKIIYSKDNISDKVEGYIKISEVYTENENESIPSQSKLQLELKQSIEKMGYKVKTNLYINGYRMDLVVYKAESKENVLLIECDNRIYTDSYNVFIDDIKKYHELKEEGYKILRVWSRDWWNSKRNIINKLSEILVE